MKLKKLVLALVGTVISFSLLGGTSLAAVEYAICTPKKVGPDGSEVILQVDTDCNNDPTDGNSLRFMTLMSSKEDQQLAVILTAISLGKTIAIKFDDTVKSGGRNQVLGVNITN